MTLARETIGLPTGLFTALVGGPPDARPVIYLHGFPDHPPTALPFLAALARTRRVIAPWLRGYHPSPTRGPHDVATLSDDVIALIDRTGDIVDLVGHDWGAAITYDVCAEAPSRIRRAVTLALPHPRTFLRAQRRAAQRRASWYMALFQLPGAAWLASRGDFALIDRLWRTWSPRFTLAPEVRAELHACLAASWPHPISYYRAAVRPVAAGLRRYRRAMRPISVPLLQLHGDADGCVLPSSAADDDDDDLFAHRERIVVPELGHFLQHEAPADLAARVTDWLT